MASKTLPHGSLDSIPSQSSNRSFDLCAARKSTWLVLQPRLPYSRIPTDIRLTYDTVHDNRIKTKFAGGICVGVAPLQDPARGDSLACLSMIGGSALKLAYDRQRSAPPNNINCPFPWSPTRQVKDRLAKEQT